MDPDLYAAAGLSGETEEEASLSSGPHLDISVGVGPITMPGYLKRTRMVTRQSDSEIKYLETERWAQPLVESLQYALVGDLSMLRWTDQVIQQPRYKTRQPAYA
ncbi:MAG: PqiC family protein, partial [Gemmatimonadales bacterium]